MARLNRMTPFLATNDINKAVDFYTSVLGFHVESLTPPNVPTFCILDCGGVSIIFDATIWQDSPQLTGQILIDVDGVDELFERVKMRAKILWGPETFDYGRREFSCSDPHGYALVFSESVPTVSPTSR